MANDKKETNSSVDDIAIMKSDITAAHARLTEIETAHENIARRLTTLEEFLPILGEHFAGRLAGTSDESNAVFEALRDVNPDALREALQRHAADAKSTEVPPGGEVTSDNDPNSESYVPSNGIK